MLVKKGKIGPRDENSDEREDVDVQKTTAPTTVLYMYPLAPLKFPSPTRTPKNLPSSTPDWPTYSKAPFKPSPTSPTSLKSHAISTSHSPTSTPSEKT
jgi:hypothetical protein